MPNKKPHPYQPEHDVHRITLYNTVYPEHQHRSQKDRLYLHFDFACFYAQIEQLRRKMYGLPLIIGGWRKDNGQVKGIVATASYEARKLGIKTGMSAFEAYKLCPHVCMLQVDYDAYTAISKQVHFIFKEFAPVVERYSMDEYFMEIDFLKDRPRKQIDDFARRLQDRIYQATYLVGAIGVARSKTYAKLASSLNKPKGRSLILTEDEERSEVWPLDVNEVWGVGRRRHEHILAEGYKTIGDVAKRGNQKTFIRLFGANFGKMLFQTITGKDQGRVMEEISENYEPKGGVSYGHTFSEGSTDLERIKGEYAIAVQQVCYRMRAYGIRANAFSGVIGFNEQDKPGVGFHFVTSAHTNIDDYVYQSLMEKIEPTLKKICEHNIEVRNLMLGTHEIDKTNQLNVFFQDDKDKTARIKAMDEIKNRFGQQYITKANTLYRVKGNTHFLERNV
jgi:DNA polymerase-4